MSGPVERIKVWVRSRFDGDRGWRKRNVDARVFGPLAVHPTFLALPGTDGYATLPSSDCFTVTHIETGTSIETGLREQDAIELVEALRSAPLSDEFWTEVKSVQAFRERLGEPLVRKADALRKRARKSTEEWERGEQGGVSA